MKPEGKIRWILLVLVLAVLCGALGYAGIDSASYRRASALFYFFLVLFVVAMAAHLLGQSRPDKDR